MKALKLIGLLLLTACASVRPPTGGDKDVTAPILELSIPANNSTNYLGDRVVLLFNEKIQLNAPSKNILISPPLVNLPEIKMTGAREMSIQFKEVLRKNTTYTINLSEAVGDLSENNKAINASFVFSTGPELDSLSISGQVEDALTKKPEENVQVILIPNTDTLSVSNSKPYYLTRTRKDGSFALNNLKEGSYNCYALTDLNGNSKYDLPKEKIAFLNGGITLPDTTSNIVLRMFVGPAKGQRINDYSINEDWGLQLISAIASDSINLQPLNDLGNATRFIKAHNLGSDTNTFWPVDTTLLRGQRLIIFDNQSAIDTITYRPKKAMPFYIALQSRTAKANTLTITASRPILEVDSTLLRWIPDSLGGAHVLKVTQRSPRIIQLKLSETKSSAIRILPDFVRGYYKDKNDSTVIKAEALGSKSFGSIFLDYKSSLDSNLIFELVDKDGNLKNRKLPQAKQDLVWKDVLPGEYRIRVIYDSNNNGRWDTGNLNENRQAEPVRYYPETITVRAGWKLELTWE